MKLDEKSSQKARFLTVGALNTVVDFVILFSLTSVGIPRVFANIVSTTAAFLTSFHANKHYTFGAKNSNTHHELIKFVVTTLFSIWVIQSSVIALTSPLFELLFKNHTLTLLFAKLAAISCGLIWNYIT